MSLATSFTGVNQSVKERFQREQRRMEQTVQEYQGNPQGNRAPAPQFPVPNPQLQQPKPEQTHNWIPQLPMPQLQLPNLVKEVQAQQEQVDIGKQLFNVIHPGALDDDVANDPTNRFQFLKLGETAKGLNTIKDSLEQNPYIKNLQLPEPLPGPSLDNSGFEQRMEQYKAQGFSEYQPIGGKFQPTIAENATGLGTDILHRGQEGSYALLGGAIESMQTPEIIHAASQGYEALPAALQASLPALPLRATNAIEQQIPGQDLHTLLPSQNKPQYMSETEYNIMQSAGAIAPFMLPVGWAEALGVKGAQLGARLLPEVPNAIRAAKFAGEAVGTAGHWGALSGLQKTAEVALDPEHNYYKVLSDGTQMPYWGLTAEERAIEVAKAALGGAEEGLKFFGASKVAGKIADAIGKKLPNPAMGDAGYQAGERMTRAQSFALAPVRGAIVGGLLAAPGIYQNMEKGKSFIEALKESAPDIAFMGALEMAGAVRQPHVIAPDGKMSKAAIRDGMAVNDAGIFTDLASGKKYNIQSQFQGGAGVVVGEPVRTPDGKTTTGEQRYIAFDSKGDLESVQPAAKVSQRYLDTRAADLSDKANEAVSAFVEHKSTGIPAKAVQVDAMNAITQAQEAQRDAKVGEALPKQWHALETDKQNALTSGMFTSETAKADFLADINAKQQAVLEKAGLADVVPEIERKIVDVEDIQPGTTFMLDQPGAVPEPVHVDSFNPRTMLAMVHTDPDANGKVKSGEISYLDLTRIPEGGIENAPEYGKYNLHPYEPPAEWADKARTAGEQIVSGITGRSGEASPGYDRAGTESDPDLEYLRELADGFRTAGGADAFRPATQVTADVARHVETLRAQGRDVVVFEMAEGAPSVFDGMMLDDTIYLKNTLTGDDLIRVEGHESLHWAIKRDPDTADRLMATGARMLNVSRANAYFQGDGVFYDVAEFTEECLCDLAGYAKTGRSNPELDAVFGGKDNADKLRSMITGLDERVQPVAPEAQAEPMPQAEAGIVTERGPPGDVAASTVRASVRRQLTTEGEIRKYIADVFDPANRTRNLEPGEYGVVDNSEGAAIKEVLGVDVTGFTRVLTNDLRHLVNKHGDAAKEAQHGQLPITPDDLARIPDIVRNYDFIGAGEKTGRGQGVVYVKRVNGTIYYVEMVQSGRRELAPKTMWKRPSVGADAQFKTAPDQTAYASNDYAPTTISINPDANNGNDPIKASISRDSLVRQEWAGWLPDSTRSGVLKMQEHMVDRYAVLSKFMVAVGKKNGPISPEHDAYMQSILFQANAAKKSNYIVQSEMVDADGMVVLGADGKPMPGFGKLTGDIVKELQQASGQTGKAYSVLVDFEAYGKNLHAGEVLKSGQGVYPHDDATGTHLNDLAYSIGNINKNIEDWSEEFEGQNTLDWLMGLRREFKDELGRLKSQHKGWYNTVKYAENRLEETRNQISSVKATEERAKNLQATRQNMELQLPEVQAQRNQAENLSNKQKKIIDRANGLENLVGEIDATVSRIQDLNAIKDSLEAMRDRYQEEGQEQRAKDAQDQLTILEQSVADESISWLVGLREYYAKQNGGQKGAADLTRRIDNKIVQIVENMPEYINARDKIVNNATDRLNSEGFQGVTQGQLIHDTEGYVVGRFGRVSNNPKWYQDLYARLGRTPTGKDIREEAINQLQEGRKDEIPPDPEYLKAQAEMFAGMKLPDEYHEMMASAAQMRWENPGNEDIDRLASEIEASADEILTQHLKVNQPRGFVSWMQGLKDRYTQEINSLPADPEAKATYDKTIKELNRFIKKYQAILTAQESTSQKLQSLPGLGDLHGVKVNYEGTIAYQKQIGKDIDTLRELNKELGAAIRTQSKLQEKIDHWQQQRATHEQAIDSLLKQDRAELEAKYGADMLDAKNLQYVDWINRFTEVMLVDTGVIPRDEWDAMKAAYPRYVPFERLMTEIEKAMGFKPTSIGELVDLGQGVKTMTGGERKTQLSTDAMLRRIGGFVSLAEQTRIARTLYHWTQMDPETVKPWVETVEDGASGNDIVSTRDAGGNMVHFRIKDIFLANLITGQNAQQMNAFVDGVRVLTNAVKATTTGYNPFFAAFNMTRDTLTTLKNSRTTSNPLRVMVDLVDAWMRIVSDDRLRLTHTDIDTVTMMKRAGVYNVSREFANDVEKVGNINSQLPGYYSRPQDIPAELRERYQNLPLPEVTSKVAAPFVAAKRYGSAVLHGVEKVMALTEQGGRVAEFGRQYESAIKRGESAENAIKRAGYEALDITVNFARSGTWGKQLDPFVLYLNASIQGVSKGLRMIHDPYRKNVLEGKEEYRKQQIRFAVKSIAVNGGLALLCRALWGQQYDDDKIPWYQRDNFYLIPKDDGTYWRVPCDRENGWAVKVAAEYAWDYLMDQADKDQWKDLLPSMADNYMPAGPSGLVFAPLLLAIGNKDYRWNDIVSPYLKDKPAPLQYDERSTSYAKAIGMAIWDMPKVPRGFKEIFASPKTIDTIIRSYTGVAGQAGQGAFSEGGDYWKAVTGRFTYDPRYNNDSRTNFDENLQEMQDNKELGKLTTDSQLRDLWLYQQADYEMSYLKGVSYDLPEGDPKKQELAEQVNDIANKALDGSFVPARYKGAIEKMLNLDGKNKYTLDQVQEIAAMGQQTRLDNADKVETALNQMRTQWYKIKNSVEDGDDIPEDQVNTVYAPYWKAKMANDEVTQLGYVRDDIIGSDLPYATKKARLGEIDQRISDVTKGLAEGYYVPVVTDEIARQEWAKGPVAWNKLPFAKMNDPNKPWEDWGREPTEIVNAFLGELSKPEDQRNTNMVNQLLDDYVLENNKTVYSMWASGKAKGYLDAKGNADPVLQEAMNLVGAKMDEYELSKSSSNYSFLIYGAGDMVKSDTVDMDKLRGYAQQITDGGKDLSGAIKSMEKRAVNEDWKKFVKANPDLGLKVGEVPLDYILNGFGDGKYSDIDPRSAQLVIKAFGEDPGSYSGSGSGSGSGRSSGSGKQVDETTKAMVRKALGIPEGVSAKEMYTQKYGGGGGISLPSAGSAQDALVQAYLSGDKDKITAALAKFRQSGEIFSDQKALQAGLNSNQVQLLSSLLKIA